MFYNTVVTVVASCLTAPSHNLNHCWVIICAGLWHLPYSNFTRNDDECSSCLEWEFICTHYLTDGIPERYLGIRASTLEILKVIILEVSLKITNSRLQPHFAGRPNELTQTIKWIGELRSCLGPEFSYSHDLADGSPECCLLSPWNQEPCVQFSRCNVDIVDHKDYMWLLYNNAQFKVSYTILIFSAS